MIIFFLPCKQLVAGDELEFECIEGDHIMLTAVDGLVTEVSNVRMTCRESNTIQWPMVLSADKGIKVIYQYSGSIKLMCHLNSGNIGFLERLLQNLY